eukprot:200139-Karenia_brevis.AAC.1
MQRSVGTFRGEGERIVDNMGEIMINLRNSHLDAVSRVGRVMQSPDGPPRDLCTIERDHPEIITTRSRWAPMALTDRPPRPPPPVRPNPEPVAQETI